MPKKLLHSEILTERLTENQAIESNRHPVSIMLHNIRSSYNVGSIFRTADSALLDEVIMSGFTPHPPKKEIEKTALGAHKSVPWQYFKDPIEAISYLKEHNKKVFALELTDKKRLYNSLEINDFPCCIVLGNELTGIDQEIIDQCDDSIEIPMYGVKHSLNVSVACGIAVFEAIHKWLILK
jgi:tRNA G18 (ribose-2'-O)-methylase SpoU